jgi:hypothetical protein
MSWITLATEDEVSERIGIRLAQEADLEIDQYLRREGNGYLKSRLSNFCSLANFKPVLLLTDLDRGLCASNLMSDWFGANQRPENLVFRCAVREAEAWLLADHDAMRLLLGSRVRKLPQTPDSLRDPKRFLLNLARKAPREIQRDLLPARGVVASQGLGYNSRLANFVDANWSPTRAASRSPSLARARQRIAELAGRLV